MKNMSKPVVEKGKDTTNIEIGSKRLKIAKILIIIAVICFVAATILEMLGRLGS